MNILFVAPMPIVAYQGGIQRVTHVLASEMSRQGHQVFFLCRRDIEKVVDEHLNCEQFYIPIDKKHSEKSIAEYRNLLAEKSIECIIFQWVDSYIPLWLQNTPSNIKVICAIHQQPYGAYGYERRIARGFQYHNFRQFVWKYAGICFPIVHRKFKRRLTDNLLTLYNRYADRICLLSQRFIPRVLKFYPQLDKSKLVGINNPLTFEYRQSESFQCKKNIILFVGRIENASKNIYGFVDVWKSISAMNSGWKAIVVGDGGDLFAMKQYAVNQDVQNIEFVGSQKNVATFYKEAKILLVTSFEEGFSMVLAEAMFWGCVPCVFDSYESVYDIVDPGVNGFISPAFEYPDMVSKIQRLINDHDLLKRMSLEAHKKSSYFNVERIALQWLELIRSIHK